MIRLDHSSGLPGTVRIRLTHSPEVFDQARKYYKEFITLRREKIAVFSENGEYLYSLYWEKNQKLDIFAGQNYVAEYFDYDIDSPWLDFALFEGVEAVLFEELEEYSYQITRMLRKKFPQFRVIFRDPAAKLFFEGDIYTNVSEQQEAVPSEVVTVSSDNSFSYDRENYETRHYSSLQIFSGLLWMTRRISFGEKNPDKTFYLIKNPVGIEGLVDVVVFCLYRVMMVHCKNRGFIPVIDIGVPGDGNQFSRYGENIWTMFFEQVDRITTEEVYQSKNVIIGDERLMIFNPYVVKELLDFDYKSALQEYLRFNPATKEALEEMKEQYFPSDGRKVLGVVGRGTDFNASKVAGIVRKPLAPEMFLQKVMEHMEEGGYENIFLATEDQAVFELFMQSPLSGRIYFVPQERIDYRNPSQNDRMLAEIYAEQDRDGYRETMKYLGILYLLAGCDALVATTNCGAYRFAVGLNGGKYDFSLYY